MKEQTMFLYKQDIESNGIYIEAETLEEAIFEAMSNFGYHPEARIIKELYRCISSTPHLIEYTVK